MSNTIIFKKCLVKAICVSLSMFLFLGSSISCFGMASKYDSVALTETFICDGELYRLERSIINNRVVATIYNSHNIIESSFTSEMTTGEIAGYFLPDNPSVDDNLQAQPYATPNYKLVATTTGSLKPAAWTTVALIAAIAAFNPGAGAAAIAALASAIVSDAGSSYTYKMLTYTASDNLYFYKKTVFKVYNKNTNKKVGPDVVTKTKTRQK